MTPITLTKPSTVTSALTNPAAKPALQPLAFTTQRQCKNKEVMAAIVDALGDQNFPDQYMAVIFKNAFQYHYVAELNRLIEQINTLHGPGSVTVSEHVGQLLAYTGIELIRHDDGTVQMNRPTARYAYPDRHEVIRSCANRFLCGEVAELLCAFDDEIAISDKNREEIFTLLSTGDASEKSLVMAAASHQHQIPWLNHLFDQFRSENLTLDLSGVDLSNLDLSAIRLRSADLRYAKLQNTNLEYAVLDGADLRFANLNGANLARAVLSSADLCHARLICAKLPGANLAAAKLTGTYFLCADLQNAEIELFTPMNDALFKFANLKNGWFAGSHLGLRYVLSDLNRKTTAYVAPTIHQPDRSSAIYPPADAFYLHRLNGHIVIDEEEKALLLAHGILITDQRNGSVQLSSGVTARADAQRHEVIDSTMQSLNFPKVLAQLIASYDDDIEISDQNKTLITDIVQSGDPFSKSALIATASRQRQIGVLNEIFFALRQGCIPLDLSHVDLSNLDLTDINLTAADLSFANLQNSCLKRANLRGALLIYANLNGTNLAEAVLDGADLSHARLIAAYLWMTRLKEARLDGTLLLCATLQTPFLTSSLINAFYQFADFDTHMFPNTLTLPGLTAAINVSIVADYPDQTASPAKFADLKSTTAVITESDKNMLLERGFRFDRNSNGTMQMCRPVRVHKDRERSRLIDGTLEKTLPEELTKIISGYDDEFDICPANEALFLDILQSNDQLAKAQIIAAASHRSQIAALNTLFQKLRAMKVTLDLSHIDLSNLPLRGINLNDANLNGANLHGCDLSQAVLRRARLVGANLNGASLESANFYGADLSDARLMGANLSRAILLEARLLRAILKFANLTKADLQGGVNLQGAYLDHANLESANFDDADLTNATLTHAKMRLTRLNRVNLTGASLVHAKLLYATLMTANLTRADFSDATLDDVTLMVNPILTGTIWTGASFREIYSDPATKKKMPLRMWMHCK